jgi:hypothetical protein
VAGDKRGGKALTVIVGVGVVVDVAEIIGQVTLGGELVHRKELRPVLTRGARAMDALFLTGEGMGKEIGRQACPRRPLRAREQS